MKKIYLILPFPKSLTKHPIIPSMLNINAAFRFTNNNYRQNCSKLLPLSNCVAIMCQHKYELKI